MARLNGKVEWHLETKHYRKSIYEVGLYFYLDMDKLLLY